MPDNKRLKRALAVFVILTICLLGQVVYQDSVIQHQREEMRKLVADLLSCTANCFSSPLEDPDKPDVDIGRVKSVR